MSTAITLELIDALTFLFCGIAIVALTALLLLQSDVVSQRLLSPSRLRVRRRREQLHSLDSAFGSSIHCIRQYMNEGGVYEAKVERSLTHICTDEDVEEMQRVCQDCIVRNSDEKG